MYTKNTKYIRKYVHTTTFKFTFSTLVFFFLLRKREKRVKWLGSIAEIEVCQARTGGQVRPFAIEIHRHINAYFDISRSTGGWFIKRGQLSNWIMELQLLYILFFVFSSITSAPRQVPNIAKTSGLIDSQPYSAQCGVVYNWQAY